MPVTSASFVPKWTRTSWPHQILASMQRSRASPGEEAGVYHVPLPHLVVYLSVQEVEALADAAESAATPDKPKAAIVRQAAGQNADTSGR
jgi:extradiol dioxygenase family protein